MKPEAYEINQHMWRGSGHQGAFFILLALVLLRGLECVVPLFSTFPPASFS